MPLYARTATAFRWRPTMLAGKADDLVRVHKDGAVQLALLANGFESGFSTCWPPASRLILDLFLNEWTASSGSVQERLAVTFARSRQRFIDESPPLVTQNSDFPHDVPGAVLIAVATEGSVVHAAWIGGDTAIVARGFNAVAETNPHTLREQLKRENPSLATDLSALPNVIVRTIGGGTADQDPPGVAAFEVEAGDTVVLLSKATFRGPGFRVEDAAFAAAVYACPSVLAERLAELAFANDEAPYAAVAVVRFDAFDLGAEIDRLIDRYERDPLHEAWLRNWALEQGALPVASDMGGVLGMRRDGSIVSVSWDEPSTSTREETSPVAHLAAVVGAARNYVELETLAPRRPVDVKACPHCASIGSPIDAKRGCPMCWYLGWMPPSPPQWFGNPLGAERRYSSSAGS